MPSPDKADAERERIRAALIALVAERGYGPTTLHAVLERAGVQHPAFERHFADLDACFVAIWDECMHEFLEVTGAAFAAAGSWREGIRAAAWAYCRFLQEDRERARFLLELSFANERIKASSEFVISSYTELVHLGRFERDEAAAIPRERAEGIVGAIWGRIATYVTAGKFEEFPAAIVQLLYLTVFPYLGADAAQEELRRGPEDIARYERGEI